MTEERKLVLFIACSLDGYIATKNESLEWLFNVEGEGDNGFAEFYETIDTVVMGRKTYDWVMRNGGEGLPNKNKKLYVFTRTTGQDYENVHFVNEDLTKFVHKLKEQEGENIWVVGGGELLYSFLQEDMVDEFIITIAPVLLGKGYLYLGKGLNN